MRHRPEVVQLLVAEVAALCSCRKLLAWSWTTGGRARGYWSHARLRARA